MLSLKEIVQFRLEELDMGPIEAAVAAGLERTFIRDIVEGKKKSVRSDKIQGLAKALRLDASALSRNEIVRLDDEPRRLSEDDEWREDVEAFERFDADGIYSTNEPYRPKIDGALPELDLELGAGEGREGEIFALPIGKETVSGHLVVAEWKFSDQWLRSEVRASSRTIVLPVIGDSMRGSYDHGDRVLVDLTQNEFIDGVVFVISVDEGAPSIKRLAEVYEVKPKRWTVISDNQSIPNREVPASIVRIVGRVVGKVSRQ